MLVFFTNLSLMEFQVRYSALFLLFSVIDDFKWFWMKSLHKNIQLMWEFLKAPFLVLHFSYYTLMTFLMMLSVILLSMLMILLSILGVIGLLICGNNLNWLLNLNVASLSLFYRYYFGRCSSELAQLVPLPFSRRRSTRYSDRLHDFSVTIPRCYKDVYVSSFFPRTAKLWNSLPIERFPLTYDLSGFKFRINRHLLTVGSF